MVRPETYEVIRTKMMSENSASLSAMSSWIRILHPGVLFGRFFESRAPWPEAPCGISALTLMSMSPFSYLCVSLLLASNGSPLLGLPSLAVSRSSSSSRRRLRSCTLIISEFSSSCCRPGLPLLSLLSICHPSLLDPYPWIHDAQNDIGQQCADDCHEPVEQDQDVRHTEVTCRYGIQEQPAHARVAVDHFYKDRAAEQCHDFITEESCNRKYGISEYM